MRELPTIDEALDELGLELPRDRKLQCPKGTDSTPSLHVYEDGFYCFHCGANGDGIGLIAFFTNQDVRRLLAQRSGGDRTRMRASTKGMKRGDVARSVLLQYREIHNEWFRWLHETWKDAPQWAFEQALDLWSQAFDDARDRMLGHGLYDEEDPLPPFQAEQLLRELAANLESAKPREQAEALDRRKDEARAAYWRRRRALVMPTVYDTA